MVVVFIMITLVTFLTVLLIKKSETWSGIEQELRVELRAGKRTEEYLRRQLMTLMDDDTAKIREKFLND